MLRYYKTAETGEFLELKAPEPGCWINAVAPSVEDMHYLIDTLGLEGDFVRAALDEEESSRVETDEAQTLIIIDVPIREEQEDGTFLYITMPVAIITSKDYIVTVSLKENTIFSDFAKGMVRNINTAFKTRFLLAILLKIATRYLQYLRQIDKLSSGIEQKLHRSTKNKELIQLLELEKSLVYFSTSLKAMEITLEKIMRGRVIKMYEEDQELLDDVMIEIKQAIEMSNIYSSILSGTMDAFASIISNNQNIVMKVLTSITIVMAIPTIISGIYGMNVTGIPLAEFWFPITLTVVVMGAAAVVLWVKKMF